MRWNGSPLLAKAAALGVLAAAAAWADSPFMQTQPGIWEISGIPGVSSPVRQCVANVAALAQFEHRGKSCTQKVISTSASSMVVSYTCGAAGFGRSQVDVITPRSLRIDTQGISSQLPFNYVLQARRVGDCAAPATAVRH